MSQCTVLVVEDDGPIRLGLVDALTYAGYAVKECDNGKAALSIAMETSPDLVLLDVMLPGGMDGYAILTEIRRTHPTLPVILVTARGAESDRVRGLTDGADDYVVKPFSAKELLARVEAVLRRSPQRASGASSLHFPGGSIHLDRREMKCADGTVRQLSEKEAMILRYLASNRGRAVDRQELLQSVWGLNPRGIETRTVDMHIARLRDKLIEAVGAPGEQIILTVRGKGYMLADAVTVDEP